jgi:hypothetical protein
VEPFDLYLYDDPELDITVWDKDQRSKDDFMGRSVCYKDNELQDKIRTHMQTSLSGVSLFCERIYIKKEYFIFLLNYVNCSSV